MGGVTPLNQQETAMRTVTIEEITGKVAINVYEGCYDHLCSLNPWGCSAELTAEEVAEGEVVVDDEYDTEGDNRGMAIYVEPTRYFGRERMPGRTGTQGGGYCRKSWRVNWRISCATIMELVQPYIDAGMLELKMTENVAVIYITGKGMKYR